MIEKFKKYLYQSCFFQPEQTVIVGLSGGADSVVLLHLLHQTGHQCIAAHCNFHLRGEESLRDENFSHSMAERLQIPYEKIDFDTHAYATKHKISIEMAARDLRYEWFEALRQKYQAGSIAVAHHKDDSVETVLLNLIRGTGIRGLTGIRSKTGYIIRPLLCFDKEEILAYAKENKLEFVTDSTNLEDVFTRNKIRLQIIPLLKSINPSVEDAIERTAGNLSQVEAIYEDAIQKKIKEVLQPQKHTIDIQELLKFPSPEALLYEILSKYNFNIFVIREIGHALHGQPGKIFYSSTHRLVKDRQVLIIEPYTTQKQAPVNYLLEEDTSSLEIPVHLEISNFVYTPDISLKSNKNTVFFDKDTLQFPLTIRHWEEGDYFIPFGMKGKQKISKYFKDHQFDQISKESAWLLCSGNDIIWIIGERSDDRYKIAANTEVIFKIEKIK